MIFPELFGRVFAGDQIFVERCDIDERGGVADGVVLVLMMHLVNADGVVSRPLAVVQALAEGEGSLVKCGSDGQVGGLELNSDYIHARMSTAILRRRLVPDRDVFDAGTLFEGVIPKPRAFTSGARDPACSDPCSSVTDVRPVEW